jgi:hypothetical protein
MLLLAINLLAGRQAESSGAKQSSLLLLFRAARLLLHIKNKKALLLLRKGPSRWWVHVGTPGMTMRHFNESILHVRLAIYHLTKK